MSIALTRVRQLAVLACLLLPREALMAQTQNDILREQSVSIAREIAEVLGPHRLDTVTVRIEGGTIPRMIENAMIAALAQRGCAVVSDDQTNARPRILVSIFDQGGTTETRTVLDARLSVFPSSAAVMLGTFSRSNSPGQESSGVWDRLGMPAVMIGTAMIIVYLLFTVRS